MNQIDIELCRRFFSAYEVQHANGTWVSIDGAQPIVSKLIELLKPHQCIKPKKSNPYLISHKSVQSMFKPGTIDYVRRVFNDKHVPIEIGQNLLRHCSKQSIYETWDIRTFDDYKQIDIQLGDKALVAYDASCSKLFIPVWLLEKEDMGHMTLNERDLTIDNKHLYVRFFRFALKELTRLFEQ